MRGTNVIFSEDDLPPSGLASRCSVRAEGGISEEPNPIAKTKTAGGNSIVNQAMKEKKDAKKEHIRRKS